MRFAINLIFSFLILSLLITVPAFAQQDNDDDFGGEGYGEKALLLEVEVFNLSLSAAPWASHGATRSPAARRSAPPELSPLVLEDAPQLGVLLGRQRGPVHTRAISRARAARPPRRSRCR